jgi:hypothetical protein
MPSMMPNDVKSAKIKNIATTNIDELRNCFNMHEGIYGITSLIMKNREECIGYLAFWKAHFRSGGTPKLRKLEMKLMEAFPEFPRSENL